MTAWFIIEWVAFVVAGTAVLGFICVLTVFLIAGYIDARRAAALAECDAADDLFGDDFELAEFTAIPETR